jgi:multicomponent Na+:H+ antiporter subunit G
MIVRIIADVLIAIGAIFALAGTIGILKMPDTFSRMQASTCVPTLGMLGAMLGALLIAIFVKADAGAATITQPSRQRQRPQQRGQ